MKSQNFPRLLLTIAAVTAACLFARDVMAQNGSSDAATISNAAQTAAPLGGAPVQLSYGVPQVLQLSQAKIGDSTIVAYIQNTGTIYSLNAPEIVYLKQQGVSDTVITTMLNQRQRVTQAAVQTAPPGGSETFNGCGTTHGDLCPVRSLLNGLCDSRHAELSILQQLLSVLRLLSILRRMVLSGGFIFIWIRRLPRRLLSRRVPWWLLRWIPWRWRLASLIGAPNADIFVD